VSTELERRLKSLEARIGTSTPCAHPLIALTNPSPEEVEAAHQTLAECPNCSTAPVNRPTMLIVRFDSQRRFNPLDLPPTMVEAPVDVDSNQLGDA